MGLDQVVNICLTPRIEQEGQYNPISDTWTTSKTTAYTSNNKIDYILTREPDSWVLAKSYTYTLTGSTEKIYTSSSFNLDTTKRADLLDTDKLREIVYDRYNNITEVRYPNGDTYTLSGSEWIKKETAINLDLPNSDYAWIQKIDADGNGTIDDVGRPIDKITEAGETFHRFYLNSELSRTYAAGTDVCEHSSGSSYNYAAASYAEVPDEWTEYTGLLNRESTDYNSSNQFRIGTKYIQLLFLANYAKSRDYQLRIDNLSFKETTSSKNLVTNSDASQGRLNIGAGAYTGDGVGDDVCFEAGIAEWTSSELIEVDPSKIYEVSGMFKSVGSAGLSRLYYGVACYDEKKNFIYHSSIDRVKHTDGTPVFTKLAHDATAGKTYVDLVDASKWTVFYHATVNFNVDPTTTNNKIKETYGTYDPIKNKWTPNGKEAYYFDGKTKPTYVKDSSGKWTKYIYNTDATRIEQEGQYNPIADRWEAVKAFTYTGYDYYSSGAVKTVTTYDTTGFNALKGAIKEVSYYKDSQVNERDYTITKAVAGSNVLLNKSVSDDSWAKGYNADIQYTYDGPCGTNAVVASFTDADTDGSAYWYSYGDYAPQEANTSYSISLWVKTEDEIYISAYTADNSESGRKWTEYVTIRPEDGWRKVTFNPIITNANNDSNSLSFHFYGLAPGKRMSITQLNGTIYHYTYEVNTQNIVTAIYKKNASNVLLETITDSGLIDDLLYEQHLLLKSFGLY